jgi:hypothetical protein
VKSPTEPIVTHTSSRPKADASVGKADSAFDCAYSVGQEARIVGTSAEIAVAVRQYRESLKFSDISNEVRYESVFCAA